MSLQTPRWWYRRGQAPALHAALTPASWIWAAATARRIARAQPYDPGVPVICVGGLTVGGAGKTPVAQALLRRLRGRGVEAVALSRGYGGRLEGPVRVDPQVHGADEVGDEPLMLARDAPAWIARDRPAGAQAAAAAGAQVIVLDDGHQNPSLKKALSVVVVDGETRGGEWPFGDGGVVPAGPLREPFAVGLSRGDAVVLMLPADLPAPDPALLALFGAKPMLIARLEPAGPPPSGALVAFAGIAKPWRFERALEAAGANLAGFVSLPDHAPLDEASLRLLAERAATANASLLTTEKDWARLPAAWRPRIAAWPVRARFEDEAALEALLGPALGGAPPSSASRPPPP